MFDGANLVYLSPHHDDICYSLGALVNQLQRGHLINIFTVSNYLANQNYTKNGEATLIRQAEDLEFVTKCDLTCRDLQLADAGITHGNSFDLRDLEIDLDALQHTLIDYLQQLGSSIIFCPMGIGGHRNHISTTQSILKNQKDLTQHTFYYYVDMPYAARADIKDKGLSNFKNLAKDQGYDIVEPAYSNIITDSQSKLDLIKLYASQYNRLPSIKDFEQEEFWKVVDTHI